MLKNKTAIAVAIGGVIFVGAMDNADAKSLKQSALKNHIGNSSNVVARGKFQMTRPNKPRRYVKELPLDFVKCPRGRETRCR